MFKLLADFFASLAGSHNHENITHKEVEQLKRSLEDNKTIVAQQLESIARLKKVEASQVETIQTHMAELRERTQEKEHYILELETAVHQIDEASAEVTILKDKLRVAQNDKTGALLLKQENEEHLNKISELEGKISELEEDSEAAISMVEKFAKELQKT